MEATTRAKADFLGSVLRRSNLVKDDIAAKHPVEVRFDNAAIPRVQQYKEYRRDSLPKKEGRYKGVHTIKKEWMKYVANSGDDALAWERIHAKYAFPFIISNRKSDAQKICELGDKLLTLYDNRMEENPLEHFLHNT